MTAPSPDLDFQQELYAAIFAAMAAALPGVAVETMPAVNQPVPYVFVGPSDSNDHPTGFELFATIKTYSAAEGTDQAKQIQHVVYSAVHDWEFTTDYWSFTVVRQVDAELILDGDRETWQGTQRFRALASLREFV